jgi:arylsulfatase A-like enzyme
MTRLFAGLLVLAAGPVLAADRPNVVLILADDFGYGSVGCYGGAGLDTKHLDRLAKEGRRFTQAYANGSVCSPTRYGLLTGRYYWRTRVKDGRVLNHGEPLHIETDRLTVASLCKSQGYKTAAFGKWHLGIGPAGGRITDWSVPLKPGPLEVGFDHFFGMAGNPWGGPHSFIQDHAVIGRVPGQPVTVRGNREDADTTGIERPWAYDRITEVLTQKAVGWLEENHKGPFFLYFAHTAVHRPIAPNPAFKGKSKFGTYGDFIHELDWSVGQVLDALDRLKVADNTLVIFTSDNGGVIATTPEHAAAQKAGLNVNGSLRGKKHDIWEGGFRVPFIARWPGKVPAGTVSDQVVCATDVLATLAGIQGVALKPGQAEDSFDARQALFAAGSTKPVRDHVILQSADAIYAVRAGDWKLVERENAPPTVPRKKKAAAKAKAAGRDELSDLAKDPSETTDVAAANPEVVARLRKLLADARERGQTR